MNRGESGRPPNPWSGLRILLLSPWRPDADQSGEGRTLFFLGQRLRERGAEVHVLYRPPPSNQLKSRGDGALGHVSAGWEGFYLAPAQNCRDPSSEAIDDPSERFWDSSLAATLEWLFRAGNFDALWVASPWLAKALDLAPAGTAGILDVRFGYEPLWRRGADEPADEVDAPNEDEQRQLLRRARIVWASLGDDGGIDHAEGAVVRTLTHTEPAAFSAPTPPREILRFGVDVRDLDEHVDAAASFLAAAADVIRRKLLPCEIVFAGPGARRLEAASHSFVATPSPADRMDLLGACDVVVSLTWESLTFPGGLNKALHRGKAVVALAACWHEYRPAHRLHKLSTLEAVMRAIESIVAAPKLVRELEAASIESVNRALALSDRLLDEAAPARRRAPSEPSLVFVLAAKDAWNGSLPLDHVCDAAQYLSNQSKVAFYVHGDGGAIETAAIARLGAMGRVIVSEAAAARLSEGRSVPARDLGCEVADFEDLLGERQIAYWFTCPIETIPLGFDLRPEAAFATLPHIAISTSDRAIADFIGLLRTRFSRVFAIDREMSRLLASVARDGVRSRIAPPLWRGFSSLALQALEQAERDAIVLFSQRQGGPLVELALRTAAHVTRRRVTVVYDDRASSDEPGDPDWSTPTVGVDFEPLTQFLANLTYRRSRPRIAAALGAASAFSAALDLLRRANVRCLSIFQPDNPLATAAPRGGDRASGVMESALLLRAALLADESGDETRTIAAKGDENNDGWTTLWDDIGRLKDALAHDGDGHGPRDDDGSAIFAKAGVACETLVKISGRGVFRFRGEGWTGAPRGNGAIEAFGLRPLASIAAAHIEYKAFGPDGRETSWVADGKLCGAREEGFWLCGFAVRLAPHLVCAYGVVYEGSFRKSGVIGPTLDGIACRSDLADDALIAIKVKIYER